MESPYKEILSAIIGGGLVGALIQGLKFIKELMDAKRKEKEAKEAKHLSDAAEIRRIENESDEAVTKALWEIIGGLKQEVADLKIELKEAEDGNSLSRPTIRNIYSSVRKLGRQINNVDWLITKQETHENLQIEMEILKQDFDDLEKHLP